MKKEFTQTLKILLAAVVLSLGISYVYAWTAPTEAPPGGNTPAPLNTGLNNQKKLGKLVLNTDDTLPYAIGLEVFGDANFYGTVKLADTGDVCDSSSAGRIRYDGLNFFGCTEDNWESLTTVTGPVTWTIGENISNFNLATSLGLSESADITLTIASGVIVSSTNTGTPALNTGNLPVGSTVEIINNGYIIGKGGAGGKGGDASYPNVSNGANGSNGGNALSITLDVTINNTNGYIYGGGGGGGGGGSAEWATISYSNYGGGGGGGGAGNITSSGGGVGVASGAPGQSISGSSGSNGSTSGGAEGFGGVGANASGGDGGAGGNYGASGTAGVNGSTTVGNVGSGGTRGFAGNAIDTNGFNALVTSRTVLGAVSNN